MDLVGQLPMSESGNRWLIVFTEYLTKWPECEAIPNAEAPTVARAFINSIICRHGCPRTLISDRGANFMSEMMQQILELVDVTHTPSTSYHPQTDGLTEKFNGTLVSMLANYTNRDQTNWDQCLQQVLFAYRASIQKSTGETPFYLLYGRDCALPTPQAYDPPRGYYHDVTDYKMDMQAAFADAWTLAKDNIQQAQLTQKFYYDKTVRIIEFEVGDLVWLETPPVVKQGCRRKFCEKFTGPWRVITLEGVNATIQHLSKRKGKGKTSTFVIDTVHMNRLKPHAGAFVPRPGEEAELEPSPESNSEEVMELQEEPEAPANSPEDSVQSEPEIQEVGTVRPTKAHLKRQPLKRRIKQEFWNEISPSRIASPPTEKDDDVSSDAPSEEL